MKRADRVAYNHFLLLTNRHTLALDSLNVLQARENVVLHLEFGRQMELGALLDLERILLEALDGTVLGEIDPDVRTTSRCEGESENDAITRVVGIAQVFATATKSQALLVTLKGLVLGI